ncbi:MAG: hypothetical protein HYS87_02890 [Candidatus Colwellbacteria bacterium]|nr:hypothetical protein [Candidatus Colwellbacteria bacterium]
MEKEVEVVKMIKCPGCPKELPEKDLQAQKQHMEAEHPEIILDRLSRAKLLDKGQYSEQGPRPWTCGKCGTPTNNPNHKCP